jgi:hypothetical protein
VAWSSVGPRACIPAVSCRVVPPMVTATTTPSDSLPARCDFPFDGIRTGCSTGRRPTGRGGEGLSSSRHHLRTFHAPYGGEFLSAASPGSSRLPWPSP